SGEPPKSRIKTNANRAESSGTDLVLDVEPMTPIFNAGTCRSEIHLAHAIICRNHVMGEEIKHGCPIHAIRARLIGNVPPVTFALLLAKHEVIVNVGEKFHERTRLIDRDIIVGGAMKDVDAMMEIIAEEREDIFKVGRALEHLGHARGSRYMRGASI